MFFKNLLILFFLVLVILLIVIKFSGNLIRNQPFIEIAKPILTPTSPSLKVIGWIPFWDQENAIDSFSKHAKAFNFVSFFWYRIDANGNLTTYEHTIEDTSIIDLAHKNNVLVLALVANMPDHKEKADWDPKRVDSVISSEKARSKHITDLLKLVEKHSFDGIDIDYEALKKSQKENFSLFIEELANKLHQKGKILGVAIHPKTSDNNPYEDNGSHAQDLTRIAKAADQLYFMTYLEHGAFSNPGPSGSVDWINEVMRYAIDNLKIPKNKVFLGVSLLGVSWRERGDGSFEGENDDLIFGKILSITKNKSIEPIWDDESKTPHIDYADENGKYIVWFENKDSVEKRLELAKKLGVGGVAFWRLGGEDPQIWNLSLLQTQ